MYIRSHVGPDGSPTRTPQSDRPGEAVQQLREGFAYLSDSTRPAIQWLEHSVRRRPGTAMAAAAGLGALVALVARRLR